MQKPRPKSELRAGKTKAPKAAKTPKVKKEKVLKVPRIDPAVRAANQKRIKALPKGAKYYAQVKLDLWGPQVTGRLEKGDETTWAAVEEFCNLPEDQRKPKKAKKEKKVKVTKKSKKVGAKSPATIAAEKAEAEAEAGE